uniref:ATP synthase complex subunit 8 n=1 Tax=Solenostomus cyanopterus TaxID=270527 RepID=A7BHR5_9TELE|nr:ATP synthase F0 subunit 8 [Solenostomus cyanopterus]BAF74890.1 ATPase subunit 8 [Solenostomus cyanopterus]BBU25687.1 ATPase subunit 8 [Solenostomus cyanopterus]
MPQLNPAPWMMILVTSWVIFLAFMPLKILSHSFSPQPSTQATQTTENKHWNWPW